MPLVLQAGQVNLFRWVSNFSSVGARRPFSSLSIVDFEQPRVLSKNVLGADADDKETDDGDMREM